MKAHENKHDFTSESRLQSIYPFIPYTMKSHPCPKTSPTLSPIPSHLMKPPTTPPRHPPEKTPTQMHHLHTSCIIPSVPHLISLHPAHQKFLNTHPLPIRLPARNRLPRLLDLLQHGLITQSFVRIHVGGLVGERDGIGFYA